VTAIAAADTTKTAAATATLTTPVQSAPTNLVTHPDGSSGANGSQVGLTWIAATNATSYAVLRSKASGGPYTLLNGSVTATYTSDVDSLVYGVYNDTSVTSGTEYYYVVRATGPSGTSG
jgi:hypothetical protein